MRLRRLDLNRYGMFEDFSLDFGQESPSAPDCHIVFGPNEAGKTTLFNGLLDCFFAFPNRTPYGFRHGSTLSVGTALNIDGKERGFVRVKKRNDSLLDDAGNPVDEELLSAALGHLSREAWTTMCSLDENSLAAGAEDILAAKGELGPIIFQSSAGLHDVTKILDAALKNSEELYVPATRGGRRQTKLRKLVAKVAEIDAELKEIDTNARTYRELRDNMQASRELEAEARSKHEFLNSRLRQLENVKIALPDVGDLKESRLLERELENFPRVPPGAIREAEELHANYENTEVRKNGAKERLDRLEREGEAIATDPEALQFRQRVAALSQAAAFSKRMSEELTRRREARNDLIGKLRLSMICIGKDGDDDPRRYVLDDSRIANLNSLTERYSELRLHSETAKEELRNAEIALRSSGDISKISASVNLEAEKLGAVANEIRAADLSAELKTASANLENARGAVDAAVATLKPWNGDPNQIPSQATPSSQQAERWREAAKGFDRDEQSIIERQERNDREIAQIQTKIHNLTQLEGLVTDEQASALRQARDQAWQTHYRHLDRETADAFKAAMDEDDRVRDIRIERSDRVAELRNIQMQLNERTASRDSFGREIQGCHEKRKELYSWAASTLALLGLPGDFALLDLPEWLKQRSLAEKAILDCRNRKKEYDEIEPALKARKEELLSGLAKAGIPEIDGNATLKRLLSIADDAADKAKEARTRLEAANERRHAANENLNARKSALESVGKRQAEWTMSWNEACRDSWLQGIGPDHVKALLDEFRKLRENSSRLDELNHRIDGMVQEVDSFIREVRKLAGELGHDSDGDPFAMFADIERRVNAAENAQREFKQNRTDSDRESREIQRTEDEIAEIRRRVSELSKILSDEDRTSSPGDLLLALRKCEQRVELQKRIASYEKRLKDLLNTETASEAEALVESQRDALDSEILACKTQVISAGEDFEERVRESLTAKTLFNSVGSDEKAAALIQDRQTVLVELEDMARRALQSRLGVFAARRALQKYREANRNELLENATNFFSRMTLGNYSRLIADGSAQNDTLIASRESDNRSCQVDDLSTSTRVQLYLSLRLAGFVRYCNGNSPLPFVADDIMESFDDDRAQQAFRILYEVSKSCQIIYLTHHKHMLEIAEKACGGNIRQHCLPAPSSTN